MQQYPSYEEYKKTDLEWLGEIPKHWKMIKTKYLFSLITEVAPNNNNYELLSLYTEIGVKPRKELIERGNRATTTDGYWLVKKGDIIVNKLLAWMGAFGISEYDGVTSPAYDILRKKVKLNEYYYHYLLRCGLYFPEFKKKSRGIMDVRLRLYFDKLGGIPLIVPPKHEQDLIADFILFKTQQIQQFVSKKQQHIQLLQEHKAAIINKAVTKGIDSNVALKDSGIEEIGGVPEHWEVVANRYILKERNERSSDGKEMLLMVSQQHGVVERAKYHEKAEVAESVIGHKKCYVGDLVLNRFKAHLGVFFKSEFEGLLSPDYTILSGKQGVEMKFYEYLFRHPAYVGAFIKVTKGIVVGLKRLYTNDLFQIKSLLPPHTEQLAILDYIQNVTSKIDESITKIQQQIQLIEEYQQSLIAQAVTGKIDVRKTRF